MAPELLQGRHRARFLQNKYNTYFPADSTPESLQEERDVMYEEIFGRVGKDSYIEPPFYVDYGCNILLGERFYANYK